MPPHLKRWLWIAGACVLVLLLLSRGGAPLIGMAVRYALPFAVGYLVYRRVKRWLFPVKEEPKSMPRQDDVIEICPHCGEQRGSLHRCRKDSPPS